jgi:undecaprenyl-diphosphatase
VILAALISYPRAIVLGLVQGVAEPFPISSLGHAVILPRLLGWNIHQNDPYFVAFLVATHLATALVLAAFFWRDWARILRGIGRSLRDRGIDPDDGDARLGWLLVVGTIPAGILGLLLQDRLRSVFASAASAAAFLIANGVLLLAAEQLRRRAPQTDVDDDVRIARQVGWPQAFIVGAAQALALIPGFSRAGATMGGSLLIGLSHRDAARFAFLLATPPILAAGVLKFGDLTGSLGAGIRGDAIIAAVAAAIAAIFSVHFLTRYFKTRTLTPFGIYCVVFGAAMVIYNA